MPILDVELVGDESPPPDLAGRIADAVGQALGAPVGATWVRLRELPAGRYAESGGGPPEGVTPVFVTVLLARPLLGDVRLRVLAELTGAVARACDRPEDNVHVLLAPPASGRMAFGGEPVP